MAVKYVTVLLLSTLLQTEGALEEVDMIGFSLPEGLQSMNGSSEYGGCPLTCRINNNKHCFCNNGVESLLNDDNYPRIINTSQANWARDLFTINRNRQNRTSIGFYFGENTDTLHSVELILFNCPEANIATPNIAMYANRERYTNLTLFQNVGGIKNTLETSRCCSSLTKISFLIDDGYIGVTEYLLEITYGNWEEIRAVYIGEIRFFHHVTSSQTTNISTSISTPQTEPTASPVAPETTTTDRALPTMGLPTTKEENFTSEVTTTTTMMTTSTGGTIGTNSDDEPSTGTLASTMANINTNNESTMAVDVTTAPTTEKMIGNDKVPTSTSSDVTITTVSTQGSGSMYTTSTQAATDIIFDKGLSSTDGKLLVIIALLIFIMPCVLTITVLFCWLRNRQKNNLKAQVHNLQGIVTGHITGNTLPATMVQINLEGPPRYGRYDEFEVFESNQIKTSDPIYCEVGESNLKRIRTDEIAQEQSKKKISRSKLSLEDGYEMLKQPSNTDKGLGKYLVPMCDNPYYVSVGSVQSI